MGMPGEVEIRAHLELFDEIRPELWEHCSNLGFLLMNGEGGEREPERAVRLFIAACDHDHAIACFTLGFMAAARGNTGEAKPLFEKACRLGDGESCASLKQLASP
ncbi:MAG: hypothetical protein WBV82_04130 [Myxococcaceae bacterium]